MKMIAAALVVFFVGAATPTKVPVGQWTYGLAASGGSIWAAIGILLALAGAVILVSVNRARMRLWRFKAARS